MKYTIIVLCIIIAFSVLTYNYAMSYEKEFTLVQVNAQDLSYANVANKSPIVLEEFYTHDPVKYLRSMFIMYKVKEEEMVASAFQVRANYVMIVPYERSTIKLIHPSQLSTHPALRVSTMWSPEQVEQHTHVDVVIDQGLALMVPCWWVVSCDTKCKMFSINSYPMLLAVMIANLL